MSEKQKSSYRKVAVATTASVMMIGALIAPPVSAAQASVASDQQSTTPNKHPSPKGDAPAGTSPYEPHHEGWATAPSAPIIVRSSVIGTTVNISYKTLLDGGYPIQGMQFRVDGGAWKDFQANPDTGGTNGNGTLTVKGLKPGVTVTFEIRAYSEVGPSGADRKVAVTPEGKPASPKPSATPTPTPAPGSAGGSHHSASKDTAKQNVDNSAAEQANGDQVSETGREVGVLVGVGSLLVLLGGGIVTFVVRKRKKGSDQ